MSRGVDKFKIVVFLLVFTSVGAITVSASAQLQAYRDINTPIAASSAEFDSLLYKASVRSGRIEGALNGTKLSHSKAIESVYKEREFKPIWINGSSDHAKVREVLEILEESWTHGLNPEDYHVSKIKKMLNTPYEMKQGQLELIVSDAVIKLGRDLSGMRVDPRKLKQKAEYWRQPLKSTAILEQISQSSDVEDTLASYTPDNKLYNLLRKELVSLSKEQNAYDHVLPIKLNSNYFKPGDRHKNVAKLRVRLDVSHNPDNGSESFYDDNLAAAVMKFQKDHGLDADGILGPKTQQILNRAKTEQMEQVIANLERMRWLEDDKPDRYIMVNIPNQMLWAIEDNKVVHEMPVVVGKPYRKTKDFKATVQGVRFNPTWTVPLSIKMRDIVPKLQKDPSYLTEKKIELIKGVGRNARTVDPSTIDWHNISWSEMGKIRMVQEPGDHNALGRIRILMPNQYTMYLHDTNHKELFVRNDRTLSSGCIRLSDPVKIADFVLSDNKDWSKAKRDATLATMKKTDIPVDKQFPVYILYQTMWLDDGGKLVYGPDVYKRDRELVNVLKQAKAYHIPSQGDSLHAEIKESSFASVATPRYND